MQSASSSVEYELWDIKSIRGSGWYTKVLENYDGKIEVISFDIESGRKLTIGL